MPGQAGGKRRSIIGHDEIARAEQVDEATSWKVDQAMGLVDD
jgi:hypothetical protein